MFKLSNEGLKFVQAELKRYETKRSAIIPCLYRVQKENGGWVSPECVSYLSQIMDLPEAWINEVLYFYTMFNKEPVGQVHVQVCNNISCSMNGSRELTEHICRTFDIKENQVSTDGKLTVTRVECLGSCDTGPMMQVNDDYYEKLTNDSAVKIVKELIHGSKATN